MEACFLAHHPATDQSFPHRESSESMTQSEWINLTVGPFLNIGTDASSYSEAHP